MKSGVISVALVALTACAFPYGFKNGGLDRNLKTAAVIPFDNKTTQPGIEREVAELLAAEMRKLGRKEAPEKDADILVTGTISRYDVDIPVAFSADRSTGAGVRRKVEVYLDVLIKNQVTGASLFQKNAMVGSGEYASGAENTGRHDAIVKVVNDIIRGLQSQW